MQNLKIEKKTKTPGQRNVFRWLLKVLRNELDEVAKVDCSKRTEQPRTIRSTIGERSFLSAAASTID